MPLSYRQVKDLYDTVHANGAPSISLPEWSDQMNALTGTDLYGEGRHDNILKRTSVGIDRLLESIPGLIPASTELGRQAGTLVDNPEAGANIGASLPRQTVNMLPYLIPGGGWAAGAARLGGAAALSGIDAYTSTGSPASGVVAGLTAAALPKGTDIVEQMILKQLGVKPVTGAVTRELAIGPGGDIERLVTDQIKRYFPETFGQRAAAFGGGQAAASLAMEGQRWGEEGFSGQPLHNPFSTENLLNLTLGQVPFAAIHGVTKLAGAPDPATQTREAIAKTEKLIELKRAQDAFKERSDIEQIPKVTVVATPEELAATQTRLSSLRQQQEAILAKPTLTPEDAQALNDLVAADNATPTTPTATSALGAEQGGEHIGLVGKQIHETAKWRKIYVSDDEANPPEFRGMVVEYSKGLREPAPVPVPGTELAGFGVTTDPLWRTVRPLAEEQARQAKRKAERSPVSGPATPELPEQAKPATELFDHITDLDKIEVDVDAAKTPAQMQKALIDLRRLQDATGREPFNDEQLIRVQQKIAEKQPKIDPVKAAIKRETAKIRRQLAAEEEAAKRNAVRTDTASETIGENSGTKKTAEGSAAPIVSLGKADADTQAIHDFIDEVISGETSSKDAEQAFALWRKATSSKDVTSLPLERERFKTYWRMKQQGDLGTELVLSPGEVRAFNDELKADGIGVADPSVLADFPERDHVLNWDDAVTQKIVEGKAHAPQPQQIKAGGGFVWGLAPYDSATNKLGGKHTLPKSGELTIEQFRSMAGRGKPLNVVELELLQALVPEAFSGKNVNVKQLYDLLPKREPIVEAKKLGDEGKNINQRVNELTHQFDSMSNVEYNTTMARVVGEARPETIALVQEYNQLLKDYETPLGERGSRYSFLGPKSETEMPGYVEGLVRVPIGRESYNPKIASETDAETFKYGGAPKDKPKLPLYTGPHFGSEDTNVLAFFRGYEETLPDGRKAFHVIEVQSDWGQEVRKLKENKDRQGYETIEAATKALVGKQDHPLLSVYETLALKAAIDHARSVGAEAILLSDAETAMMTEGHDKNAGRYGFKEGDWVGVEKGKSANEGWKVKGTSAEDVLRKMKEDGDPVDKYDIRQITTNDLQPDQAGGMRLHYDTTLPSALKRLTGTEGERVEVGSHKMQRESGRRAIEGSNDFDEGVFDKGSPVFRNPDGTPKSSISGRLYDLSSAFANSDTQGGFTLGDPSRAPQLNVPRTFRTDVPEYQEVATRLTTDGVGLTKELLSDNDPFVSSIASDLLARFPEALSRIDSGVYEVPGSYAARRPANRVGIFLDASLPSASRWSRNNVVLHELIHGLTLHELANPKVDQKLVSELTQLRQKLIDALPKELRTKYDEAVDSDWYARFTQGQAFMDELGKKPQVIYALLNNDELAAQGFSDRSVREYMQSVGGKKSGAWKTFTNWVKNILGLGEKVDGTAFGDFLSTTSQLMAHGEWLSDFANFGERYFESQGRGGSYGRAQTQRALGLITDASFGVDHPLTLATSLDLSSSRATSNLELRRARREYQTLMSANGDDAAHVNNVLAELGHKDIDSMVTSAIGEGQDISDALDLLPPEASSYVFEKLRDAKDVLEVTAAAASDKNKGLVNLANPKFVRESVNPVLREVNRALAHEEFQTRMATDLAGLSAVAPEGFLDALPHMAPQAFEDFVEGAKDVGGKAASGFARFLEPVGQWARRVPEVAEAVSKGFQLASNSRKMFNESVKWLGMDTSSPYVDVLTHESVQETEKALANPKLFDKINRWMFLNNKKGNDAVAMLPENDADVAKLLSGLSDDERTVVRDVVNKAGKVTQMMNAQKLEKMNQIAATYGAGVAALTSGLKTRDNVTLSSTLLKAIQDSADPMTSQRAMLELQSVQQRMQPQAFMELYDFLKGESDKIGLWKKYFDANPFWATAQRTERFLLKAFNKAGKPGTLQASTIKEARDIIDKKGYKLKEPPIDQWSGREDEPFAFPNMTPEMAKRMQEIEENQLSMLSKVLSPEDLAEVRRTSAVSQVLRESTAERSIPGVQAPPRLLSQGAEELPWMWNHISWAQRESSYWSRQLLRAQARTYLNDVEIKNHPERERLKTHFDNLLLPDPKIAQQMTRFASTWFLGFNLATTLINAAQPFTTHVSELTALTGKPLDSYRRVLNALGELGGKFIGRKDWATKEHELLMTEAVKDGEVGIGMFDDEAAAQESLSTNYKRAMKKNAPQTLGQKLGTAAGAYSTAGMWLFQHGERVNARAALLASFDHYREQGLTFKEAKEKAYEFNRSVNYGGGRAQRSVGLYSSRSPFLRGAAMLGTSLQSYVLGTTFQIARYIARGAFRPNGLTPHETFAARRAAIQMLATQFAAAGVLGMPFVSGALVLLDKAFPELELNRKTRETVNSFLGGDEENGSTLTDMAMTGVPSMLGWDMQSRLSMGNSLPGVSEINGFQPEQLMGPTANIVKNFVNGVEGWTKGDAKATLNFLPPAVRKTLEAANASLGGQGIRDYQGRPLAEPTRGEALGSFLGFQPKRLSDQNAASRMLAQSEEVLRTQESRWRSQQAEEVLRGNYGTVRQELQSRIRASSDYDAVGAVQAIARASEELAFPRDLRREGTRQGSGARSALLGTFGSSGQASEVQRLQFRKQIEARLGLQGDSGRELKIAMLMDQLRLQNPDATRLELKSSALEAFRRASPRTLGLPLESQ